MKPWICKVDVDEDFDTVVILFVYIKLTFYKAYRGRMPIITWGKN